MCLFFGCITGTGIVASLKLYLLFLTISPNADYFFIEFVCNKISTNPSRVNDDVNSSNQIVNTVFTQSCSLPPSDDPSNELPFDHLKCLRPPSKTSLG